MTKHFVTTASAPGINAAAFGPELAERDIDFLILEEVAINPGFLAWMFQKAGVSAPDPEPLRLERSVSTYIGESDLVLVVKTNGCRHALLVENKIAAVFQPAQPARYRKRGEAGQASSEWEYFTTVLLAPAAYLNSAGEATQFDAQVSYEDIVVFYSNSAEPRDLYRARVIASALKKSKQPWVPTIDPTVTDFFARVREFAREMVPGLPLPFETGRAPTNTWLTIRIDDLPARVLIEVKTLKGWSDLRLYQVDQIALQTAFKDALPKGFEVVGAAKSAAIRLSGPPVNPRDEFAPQIQNIAALLENAQRLYHYAVEHRSRINGLL